MNRRRVAVGVLLLNVAAVYFYFAPALVISAGMEVFLWVNIVPGIVLAVLGIALLAKGLKRKKEGS